MAEPLIISASTAPTGTSVESPPVFGSTPSLGIVSRITPSFAEVLLPELVVAPEVVFAAPVLAAVVVPVVASVVSVVLVVLVVVPVVVPVVPVVPVVVPLVRVLPVVVVPVVVLVVLVVVVVPVVPVVLVPVVCSHALRVSP
jgi:hypothetical protein